ncbi:MAG: helix-turn-helix domain-containing protein, partial [Phocaeicola sp.]|nr:helix-turn-helix domain-containing protein [Phocaeicola sp.]
AYDLLRCLVRSEMCIRHSFSTLEAICRELECQPGDILEFRDEDE